jgi:DNA-binding GntR family transcriptional regulator
MCYNEYFIKWVLTLVKLHREFYRTAWYARRRYERLLYEHLQILNNNPMYN